MSSRQQADYEIDLRIDAEQAQSVVAQAEAFVFEVEKWLRQHNLL